MQQGYQEEKQQNMRLSDFHLTPLWNKFESFLEARARRVSGKTVCTHVFMEENIRDSYSEYMTFRMIFSYQAKI